MLDKTFELSEQLRRTLNELKSCESILHGMMTKSAHGLIIVDYGGTIHFANPTASEILGCSEEELPGKQFQSPVVPGEVKELQIKSQDGKTVTVEVWGSETEWDGKQAHVVMLDDVTERRKIEQELRKLNHAVTGSPSSVMITDAQGNIEYVNPKFGKLSGYTFAETVGRNPRFLKSGKVPPETYKELWETITRGEEWRGEMINRKKNGELYHESVSIAPVFDLEGKIINFIAVTEDITERKKAEDALRFSEARYRALYHDNPVMIFTLDTEGTILSANSICASQLGYTKDELEGQPALKIFHEDDRPAVAEQLRMCLQNPNQVYRWQFRKICKDGSLRWVEEMAQAVYDLNGARNILVVCQDITERRQAEEALRESEERLRCSEERLRLAIESTGLGTFDFDPLTGELVWSDLAKLHFGLSPDVSVDYGIFLAGLHPGDRERVERIVEDMLRPESGGEFSTECRTIGIRDGNERWIAARGRVFFDESRQAVRFVGTTLDITERKRLEEEIKRLNTNLAARAVELETANLELEAFNYSASHDLRKPLTIINGYCQVILELCGTNLDEQCRNYLQEISNGTLQMNHLIDTLLGFSRLTRIELHRETIDLSAIAKAVTAELHLTEPGRRVTFQISEGITTNGDADLLRIVLDNLIGNAWKYTGKREQAVIEFGATEIEGKPAYFVRDNGSGFDMAYAGKLFIPFQRLPSTDEFKGHGIGLATVERIVMRHGGKVWAESETGKGATFYFTLSA